METYDHCRNQLQQVCGFDEATAEWLHRERNVFVSHFILQNNPEARRFTIMLSNACESYNNVLSNLRSEPWIAMIKHLEDRERSLLSKRWNAASIRQQAQTAAAIRRVGELNDAASHLVEHARNFVP